MACSPVRDIACSGGRQGGSFRITIPAVVPGVSTSVLGTATVCPCCSFAGRGLQPKTMALVDYSRPSSRKVVAVQYAFREACRIEVNSSSRIPQQRYAVLFRPPHTFSGCDAQAPVGATPLERLSAICSFVAAWFDGWAVANSAGENEEFHEGAQHIQYHHKPTPGEWCGMLR
jgi:hypothetical protein